MVHLGLRCTWACCCIREEGEKGKMLLTNGADKGDEHAKVVVLFLVLGCAVQTVHLVNVIKESFDPNPK